MAIEFIHVLRLVFFSRILEFFVYLTHRAASLLFKKKQLHCTTLYCFITIQLMSSYLLPLQTRLKLKKCVHITLHLWNISVNYISGNRTPESEYFCNFHRLLAVLQSGRQFVPTLAMKEIAYFCTLMPIVSNHGEQHGREQTCDLTVTLRI